MWSNAAQVRRLATAVAFGAVSLAFGCHRPSKPRLVALFCLDGASFDVIDALRARGKLKTFEKLIRSGASGSMESLAARRLMSGNSRRGYWSPIVWASIATGVVPEKHGIRDFLLPVSGTSQVWMGSEEDPPRAELSLPEIRGRPPFLLRVRLRSHTPNGTQSIAVFLNEEAIAKLDVPVEWTDLSIPLEPEGLRPGRNRLVFEPSRQSRPSDGGVSSDHRLLAAELGRLEVLDGNGKVALAIDPAYHRFDLGPGFYQPEADVVEAQSRHFATRPLWDLLGELGHPVGVIGYWSTWPASPVHGFLVSSRMGLRGRRQNTQNDLTWPKELASELLPLYPTLEEMAPTFSRIHLSECDPPLSQDENALPDVLRQDELYFRAAKKLLPSMGRGLFIIYFESIDAASHAYLPLRDGGPVRTGCPESVRDLVDEVYAQIDRWMGELIEILPDDATIVVVSDHGLVTSGESGLHSPYGIFMASGEGIRQDAVIHGPSPLDVAPTLLYAFSEPVPLAMDGSVLVQMFESEWLEGNPPRYRELDITKRAEGAVSHEGAEEVLERLKSIGYIH